MKMRIAAACALVGMTISFTAPSAEARSEGQISIAYTIPKRKAFRKTRTELSSHKVFERVREILGAVQLPTRLHFKAAECGESNAWYAPETRTVTLCYELVKEIEDNAPKKSFKGITRREAIAGPLMQVLLHETAHGMFDLLKIPVLGHEEDAADEVAALVLLKLSPVQARSVVNGTAYSMAKYARREHPTKADFADEHPLWAQRFISLICLAYGSDQKTFGYLRTDGFLPKDRAEVCPDEFDHAEFAFTTLFRPHLDRDVPIAARIRRAFQRRVE